MSGRIFSLINIPLEARIILQSILTCSHKYQRLPFGSHFSRNAHYSASLVAIVID
jgi:hypothetical protein